MVLNTHYGDRSGAPFDLAHKGGPILYKLAPDADKATIDTESKSLKKKLKDALELFKPKPVVKPFVERVADKAPAFFYSQDKPIGGVGNDTDRLLFHVEHGPAFYLRVVPTGELQRPLGEEYLWKNVQRLGNFGKTHGGVQRTNEDGASFFEPRGTGSSGYVDSISQAFRNGELWGINTTILDQGDRDGHKWILQAIVEQVYLESFPPYLDFIQKISGASPPFTVEAGLTGMDGDCTSTLAKVLAGSWAPCTMM